MSDHRRTFEAREFRKASMSEPNRDCVRVARDGDRVEMRDDKTTFGGPDDLRLLFTAAEFDQFQAGVRAGVLDGLCIEMISHADGTYTFRRTGDHSNVALKFSRAEVEAFFAGVRAGEFDLAAYAA